MKIKYTKNSIKNLEEIFDYSKQHNKRVAYTISQIIELSINNLLFSPYSGRAGLIKNTRELIIPKTKYILVYRLKNEIIEIIAVVHSSMDWHYIVSKTIH